MQPEQDPYSPDYKRKMSMLADMLRQQGAPGGGGGMGGAIMGGLGQGAQLGQSLSGLI
jgi:predicted lipid-binding transport protein (Tim44 family)